MVNLDFREIWFEDKLIGRIGQKESGEIIFTSMKGFKQIMKSFIAPIKIEIAAIEGDISVSDSRIVLLTDTDWLAVLDQGLPPEYFVTTIQKLNKDEL